MLNIFKAKDMEYPEILNKPVRYNADFLKDIASKTGSIKITNEHTKEVIGVLENFVYENGYLKAKSPEDLDLKGMGLSPVFDCDLIEEEDCFIPINGVMSEIGLTKNPRNRILYNSIEIKNSEGENVSESLDILVKEKQELQKKIGVLENESKSYKNLLKQKDEEIKKIEQSYSDIDAQLSELESLREKAGLYDDMQKSIKDDLIDEICGKNDALKGALSKLDVESLKTIKENPTVVKSGQGIPPQGNPVDNGDNPSNDDEDDDVYSEEDFLKDYEAAGWE